MATTTFVVTSERLGTTYLTGSVANLDNADVTENFILPTGFGDALVYAGIILFSGIVTAVLNPELRGPVVYVVSPGGSGLDTIGDWPTWRKVTASALVSQHELLRPVLFRQQEMMNVQSFGEDTGAGDAMDVTFLIRVQRLRNLGL